MSTTSRDGEATVDEAIGQLVWDNVETSAPGGSFDPGETVLLTVNFNALAATPDPDRAHVDRRMTGNVGVDDRKGRSREN